MDYIENHIQMKWNNLKKAFYLLLLFIQVFEYALFNVSSIFKSVDEIVAGISLLYLLYEVIARKAKIYTYEVIMVVCLLLIIVMGFSSNIIYQYQPLKVAISDLIIFSKFVFGYFLGRLLLKDIDLIEMKNNINLFCRVSAVVLFALVVINVFTGIFPQDSFRFFMRSQMLFFGQTTYLGSTCVILISLLMGTRGEKSLANTICILLCMLAAFTTFRYKIIIFLLFCLFFLYYSIRNKEFSKIIISIAFIVSFLVSLQQLKYYYVLNSDFARNVLTKISFKIANDHFPLGSGFATFASYQSGLNYSPLYHRYGIDKIWGITRNLYFFISDTFWPMIIGQFGYFGLILYALLIFSIFFGIYKLRKSSYAYFYSALMCLIYLLITSTAESSFVQPYAVALFYIIGMYMSQLLPDKSGRKLKADQNWQLSAETSRERE